MAVAAQPFYEKTDEQKAIIEMVRQFVDEQIIPKAEHYDSADEFPGPIVEQMGMWAQQWRTGALADDDLDDKLLMWGLRRSLRLPPGMDRRVLLRFDFHGLPRSARVARRSWWLLAQQGEVEICVKDPGYDVDVLVVADLRAFTEVILGRRSLPAALREGCVKLQGAPAFVRQLRQWLPLNGEARETMNVVKAQ